MPTGKYFLFRSIRQPHQRENNARGYVLAVGIRRWLPGRHAAVVNVLLEAGLAGFAVGPVGVVGTVVAFAVLSVAHGGVAVAFAETAVLQVQAFTVSGNLGQLY